MKTTLLVTIFLLFISNVFAQSEDVKSASDVPDKLFTAMKAKSFEEIRSLFTPEGQLVALDKPRDGKGISKSRVFTAESFAKNISEAKGMDEKDVAEFPMPTGQYGVGRTSFHWIDLSRDEPMTADADDHREITVYLWYPIKNSVGATPAPYFPDLDLLKKEIKGRISDALRATRTHAIANAQMASTTGKYPVVLLMHGNEMNTLQYSIFSEELASHGYIVVGIESPGEARGMILSGGRTLGYNNSKWGTFQRVVIDPKIPFEEQEYPKFYHDRVDVRAADASFVLDQLEKLNSEKQDNQFAGHLDLQNVGIFGHSHGGVAAVSATIRDKRFKASINLDGLMIGDPYFPDKNGNLPNQPFMLLTKKTEEPSDKDLEKRGITRQQWRERIENQLNKTFGHLKSASYRVVIEGSKHTSFSDDAMMVATLLKTKDSDAQRRYAQIMRAYILAFFDKYLLRKSVELLNGVSPDYPEVEFRNWN